MLIAVPPGEVIRGSIRFGRAAVARRPPHDTRVRGRLATLRGSVESGMPAILFGGILGGIMAPREASVVAVL
jgi:TRAP-type C4-dicarboxylate transport system permease large subunit